MFEVKPAYSVSPTGDKLMMIDETRDVWLQYIGGYGSEPGAYFKLVWKGQEIAFLVIPENRWDDEGKEYIVQHIYEFGGTGPLRGSVKPWKAETPQRRREAMLLAVEALLAYGGLYDGYKKPDGLYRVEFEGRLYIKSDFGLP